MNDLQWTRMIQDVANQFDDLTLKRGFNYYKQNRVEELSLEDAQLVHSTVHGTEDYEVTIDLEHLYESECSCPVSSSCKHIAATLMEYASRQERPVTQLANAQVEARLQRAKASLLTQTPARKAAKQKLTELTARADSLSLDEWHELFELSTGHLHLSIGGLHYMDQALKTVQSLRLNIPKPLKPLFEMHLYLYMLNKIIDYRGQQRNVYFVYGGTYTDQAVSELLQVIIDKWLEAAASLTAPEHTDLLRQTVARIRERMLAEPAEMRHYLRLYTQLWMASASGPTEKSEASRASESLLELELGEATEVAANANQLLTKLDPAAELLELEKLHETALDRASAPPSPSGLAYAQATLLFLSGRDEEFLSLLNQAADYKFPMDMVLAFPRQAEASGNWERLEVMLPGLTSFFAGKRRVDWQEYMSLWDRLTEHKPEAAERMWHILTTNLPHSRGIYEDMLYKHGQWKIWIELQLVNGRDPLDFRVSDLQPIEKAAPEMLLPFFHQSVERYVAVKNRDGYKSAVKLLKRLSKLYKKMKMTPRFETYMASFIVRYQRLRALQEELRKGKLAE
ncbi:SWIM zinc finger family protein [Paenibacillus swuensis]|uniref:SWIM zinc finger family protein n=1 Tax=Paenibacillus swuensis TaxID=1178515 RepID=UPI0008392DD3|nr:SWIM zinc finger family protein [Paenibacillus swuensis]